MHSFASDPSRGTGLELTAQERDSIDFADAALGLADHQVTDQGSRARAILVKRGEMTVEQARQAELDDIARQLKG